MSPFSLTLEDTFMLSPNVKHFICKAECDPPFEYLAGQFITLHFTHEDKTLKRSYSIANPPKQDNLIEFAAGFVEHGPGSAFLFQLQPGDKLVSTGPYGRLILKEALPKRLILVATSTGVTPYRAMLPDLIALANEKALEVVILQGVQCQKDALYVEEFLKATHKNTLLSFKLCFSRETQSISNAYEQPGYVQHAFPDLHLNAENDMVYLCGNPAMVDESFAALKERGFNVSQIIREKYTSGK